MSQQDAAEVLALSERLLIASHKGQADSVVQLINRGAKVAVTKYGRSPLHLAAYKGHMEVVRLLLAAGCDLDIQDDVSRLRPLPPPPNITLAAGSLSAAVWTRSTWRKVMAPSGLEWDPLDCPLVGGPSGCEPPSPTDSDHPHLWVHQVHSLWSVSSATGCSTNSRIGGSRRYILRQEEEEEQEERKAGNQPARSGGVNEGEQTALHRAAVVGNSDVISALIQEGCALDRQDKDGNSALHEVSWHGFSQSVKLLVKAGANVHSKNKAGNTSLHLSCQNGHTHSTKVLLLGGARPDSKNQAGDTCLHVAARYNHVAVIHILLGAFCSVSQKNLVGDSPLHIAAALNHKKTVRLLLEAGADGRSCNSAGQTPLDQARENNNPEVALLLTKAPQVQSFVRGRSVRKRRDKLKAEGRAQSVPRDEMFPCKDSVSAVDDSQSSERAVSRRAEATETNSGRMKSRRQKDKPSLLEPLRRRENKHGDAFLKRRAKLQGAPPHACTPPHNYKAYQLYTLYRGKDGKIMQAPLNGCRCEPLISKLENQLEATKEEMKSEICTVQDLMNSRMGNLERRNRHQIRALDKMTVERVSAQRSECVHRMEQRVLQERQEAERRQASLASELKTWCLSELQNMEVRFTVEPPIKLPGSSSEAAGLMAAPPEPAAPPDPITVPPGREGAGSGCPDLPSSPAVLEASRGGSGMAEGGSANPYFVVHVESLPDGDEARSCPPFTQVVRPKEHPLTVPELQQRLAPQDLDPGGLSVTRTSNLSPAAERHFSGTGGALGDGSRDRGRHHQKRSQTRTKSRGAPRDRILEVFGEPAGGPSFAQERDNMHALEVTQFFFQVVSTQMERWYERKVEEARWQSERRAQADRAALVDRISYLEEQLRLLRTQQHHDC